jgi:WD40 repeat protein
VDGQTVASLSDHEAPVNAVSWSPDGKWLASGCENKTIRYWTADGKPGPMIDAHIGPVRSLAWNFNGTQLLSCDHGIESSSEELDDLAHIKIWDAAGKLIATMPVDKPLSHVCWKPDGSVAVAGGARMVWSWPSGEKTFTRFFAPGVNVPVAWRPSGDLIAAGPQLHSQDGQPLPGLIPLRTIVPISPNQNPAGTRIGVGRRTAPAAYFLFDSDGKQLPESDLFQKNGWVQVFAWSPDGKTFIPAQRTSGEFQRFDFEGNKVGDAVTSVAFMSAADWSRDGRYVAGGGSERIVQLIDLQSDIVKQIGKQAHGITQVRFTPDQTQVCSAGYDGCVRFWSLDGKPGKVYEAVSAPIRGLAWAPDGQVLASGHEDHTIRLWNSAGEADVVMGDHGDYVEWLDFNPDGTLLASASRDSTVRLWNRDGAPLKVLRGHEGSVTWVQWTRDGKGVLSCADDGSIRHWNAATGLTEWQVFIGQAGGYVALDSTGRVKHGDEKILESDFVVFAEDEQGNLVRTEWADIRAQFPAAAEKIN